MRKKTERVGILSLHERELIKEVDRIRSGQPVKIKRASSRLSQVLPDLDRRVRALTTDLEIILSSRALQPFVASRIKDFSLIIERYHNLQQLDFGENYSTWLVRYTRKSPDNEKKLQRVRRYWLDINDANKPEKFGLENFFSPEYALRNISGKWVMADNKMVDTRQVLLEGLKLEMRYRSEIIAHEKYDDDSWISDIFPKAERDATPLQQIRARISNFPEQIRNLEQKRAADSQVLFSRAKYEEIQNIKDPKEKEAAAEAAYRYAKELGH